jgi:hypothetical protein
MTIDVEAESACVDWSLAYTNLWDRYIALCDAAAAERERVRGMREHLAAADHQVVAWQERFADLENDEREKVRVLVALRDEQKARIDWLLDERGGAAHDASYVASVEAARDGAEARVRVLRAALRDAMRHTHSVPMAAFETWLDALAATDDGGGA